VAAPSITIGRAGSPSAQTIVIGSPTTAPGQTVNVGLGAATVSIGTIGGTAPSAPSVNIGALAPTLLPTQTVKIGTGSSQVDIGTGQPSSMSVTIGKTPSPAVAPASTSSRIKMQGLYHYFFSGTCIASGGTLYTISPAPATKANCNYAPAPTPTPSAVTYTNAAISPTYSPSGGYAIDTNYWHPPEPGHYLISVTGSSANSGVNSNIFLYAAFGSTPVRIAVAFGGIKSVTVQISTSRIVTFDTVGSGYYIYVEYSNIYQDPDLGNLVITRIA
jgi:hypothetical protein